MAVTIPLILIPYIGFVTLSFIFLIAVLPAISLSKLRIATEFENKQFDIETVYSVTVINI